MFKRVRFIFDGTPCEVKAACTVWSGGKSGDDFKGLPITIRLEIAGMKQLMAGGGIILLGTTLIPLLSGLF